MANPVWVLSVDLQTKTATFQSGMADAAKSARGAFRDIGDSAEEGFGRMSEGTTDVRHSLGLMDNAIRGNHAAAMVDMIRLFQSSSIVMAALPFAGVIGGVILLGSSVVALVNHLEAMREAEEKIRDAQTGLGTKIQDVFNGLDAKLLAAQKQADELSNNHLAALHTELEIIDKTSLEDLRKAFDDISKEADSVFGVLKASWYEFGSGSVGASHALKEFKVQYDSLLAQGKDKEASGLLTGTLAQAQSILKLQREAASTKGADYTDTSYAAQAQLHEKSIGYTEKEMQSQAALVQMLHAQVEAQEKVDALKKASSGNATHREGNEEAGRASAAARESAESMGKMGQQSIAAEKATADALLETHRASLEARLASDIDFAGRERDLAVATNQADISALNKSGPDYLNQLKALQDKALEIQSEYDAKVTEMTARSSVEVYNRDLENLQQSEREKIEAATQGTAERLAAIDAAIKEEQGKQLQDTEFYRQLQTQRVEAVRQELEQESKLRDAAIKETIAATNVSAQEQARHAAEMSKIKTPKGNDDFDAQKNALQQEYVAKHAALEREMADTQTMGVQKVTEQQRINDQIEALEQKHQDQMAELAAKRTQAERADAMDVANQWGQALLRVGEGHESLARLAINAFDSMASHALEAALMQVAGEKTAQLAHAESAAAAAWGALAPIPFVGPALGAVAAAATFAGAMAFEKGGIVPGMGDFDSVPAMLTPGEGVVPKGVMDGLSHVARDGGFHGKGPTYHLQLHPTYHINTIDGDGMKDALDKHTDQLTRHFEGVLRKMNR